MTDETYNGWSNYETWHCALVLDNDEGTYTYVRERLEEMVEEYREGLEGATCEDCRPDLAYDYSQWLKSFVNELRDPEMVGADAALMYRDFFGSVHRIDFAEIAEAWVGDFFADREWLAAQ